MNQYYDQVMELSQQTLEALNPVFNGKDTTLINDALCVVMANVIQAVAHPGRELALCEENFQNVIRLIRAKLHEEETKTQALESGIIDFRAFAKAEINAEPS